jgi:hypothetical protein
MGRTRRTARTRSTIIVFALTAVLGLVAAGGTPAEAATKAAPGKAISVSGKGVRVTRAGSGPCWEYQDTVEFGNAAGTQGSGTYHILWCANAAKTSVTSIPKAQYWCTKGPRGYYTYDGCDKHHGVVPNSRVRFTIHWNFHILDVFGFRVNKTLTVDGYVYPNGGIQGTMYCC